jgi:MoxR-like ATPase
MSNTVWVVTDAGFEKAEIIDAGPNSRRLKMLEGKREGKVLLMPPVGTPNGEFHPALYEGAEPPNLWRFDRRSLRVRDSKDFADRQQAEALIPQEEPYTFLPHTLHVIDGILARDHQLLFGPTGVGKTSLVLQIAARIKQPVVRVNLNGQISVSDLVGSIGLCKDGTIWNDGALPRAMRNGYWLVLDEIDFGPPDVLSLLYPVLESKPRLCLKEHNGEVVEAHPNFRVFATGNSIGGDRDGHYAGTQPINAALLNRFTGHGQAIRIKPLTAKQEEEILASRLPNLSKSLVRRACEFANRLRQGDGQNAPLLPTLSTRELIQFCAKTLLYRDPLEAANLTFLSVVEDSNVRQPVEEAVKLIFGKRVVIGRQSPSSNASERIRKSPRASRSTSGVGRVASEITDPSEMAEIWAAYKKNGGALSFQQIERDPRFNLRPANGNTAFRIIKKFGELKKCAAITP